MSAGEALPEACADEARLPEFDLSCLFDDMEDPTEVTVFFPVGERTVTEWITADRSDAVALDQIR